MRLRHMMIASSILASFAASRFAFAAEPTYQELKDQLRQLQARVDSLERAQNNSSATTAQIESTRQAVLSDAEKRSALPGNDITAGYDKGFFIRSSDGSFTLR